jgi:7,8-dihydropterin-6-yl-methyl-4-(beta-D-ribofuranosyl)aminobenzene 5'-phosphate synthase
VGKGSITIIYDNLARESGLRSGHGFSCLIGHASGSVLFDTGRDAADLLYNMERLDISPEEIDTTVLSHAHKDHAGGMDLIIERNPGCLFYSGRSFPLFRRAGLKEKEGRSLKIDGLREISEGFFAGPEMGIAGLREIPLTLRTAKGLVIITGCAHPGIIRIVREIKSRLGGEIHLVLGGFHMELTLMPGRVSKALKELGVGSVGPCHCTGARARKSFRESFGEGFLETGAGYRIDIER